MRVMSGALLSCLGTAVLTSAFVGCSGIDPGTDAPNDDAIYGAEAALGGADSLLTAYQRFETVFKNNNQHKTFQMGFGFTPGISFVGGTPDNSGKITIDQTSNAPVSGSVTLHMAATTNTTSTIAMEGSTTPGRIEAVLEGPMPGSTFANTRFDLWLVKNRVGGSGRPEDVGTVKPEEGDVMFKVGTFTPPTTGNRHTLSVEAGAGTLTTLGTHFDLDMVVVTIAGTTKPTMNIVATGARTLFEKRFFRAKHRRNLDAPTGPMTFAVHSKDTLVRRGAFVFFNEKFAGNGRTCGTCHRDENNLTIDEQFIATLPPSDPLFTAVPGLEDPTLIRKGLIRENIDGNVMEGNNQTKFVMRSVPHTLAMATTLGAVITGQRLNEGPGGTFAEFVPESVPPDHRTGWSGDGAPGRGTLNEFAIGAVVQHFTLSTSRFSNSFRLPTQEEVDTLEAFQLFSGRQKNIFTVPNTYKDPAAEAGKNAAFIDGQCVACHRDMTTDQTAINFNVNTGTERLTQPTAQTPRDGGSGIAPNGDLRKLGGFGNGQFNTPPLLEAADTGPFFHNNSAATIEAAVEFYRSPEFTASPGFSFTRPALTDTNIPQIAAFLRTVNALANIKSIRERITFVKNNPASGNTARRDGNTRILQVAQSDIEDALEVLTVASLSSPATTSAKAALNTALTRTKSAITRTQDADRATLTSQILTQLATAKSALVTINTNQPDTDF